MRPDSTIPLLIFGVYLLLEFYVSTEACSGDHEYTVVDANDKFLRCQSCGKCHKGYGLKPKCGKKVTFPVVTSCEPCLNGTYSDTYDSGSCETCQSCVKHEIVTSHCTPQLDTNCSRTCDDGYYFAKAPLACHKCSFCCSDEKDEVQSDCVKQGLDHHCSPREDRDCSPEHSTKSTTLTLTTGNPNKQGGNKTNNLIIAITFGVLGGVLVVAVFIWVLWKRRRRSRDQVPIGEQAPEHVIPMIAGATSGDEKNSTASSQNENGNVFSPGASATLSNPPPHGTGRPSPHAFVSSELNPGYDSSNPGTPRLSPNVTPHHTDDELDTPHSDVNRRRRTKRQKSQESQTSKGQIKIVEQPKSQNQTVGSRVEFTCKCKVQKKSEVWYQWYKDDTELEGQNTSSLVLYPVKMSDFGSYRCHVTHMGEEGGGTLSDLAILEVLPCGGMRRKFLRDVDFDTRDKVAIHLGNKAPGLGGWRQVAAKYGMDELQIRGLEKSHQPGQDVMEFIGASKPDLTVYSFCKTLKEANMKRLEIVKVLEPHLTVKIEGK